MQGLTEGLVMPPPSHSRANDGATPVVSLTTTTTTEKTTATTTTTTKTTAATTTTAKRGSRGSSGEDSSSGEGLSITSEECNSPMDLSKASSEEFQFRHNSKKRPFYEDEEVIPRPLATPLELIRAKYVTPNSSFSSSSDRHSPDSAGGSSTSSTSPSAAPTASATAAPTTSTTAPPSTDNNNKEVKKRRLDALLSRKFRVSDTPTSMTSTEQRRKRKQTLSIRPPSDLFPKTNKNEQDKEEVEDDEDEEEEEEEEEGEGEEGEDLGSLKTQILQLQLAQAALLNGDVLKNAFSSGGSENPLLYYGYYAQMLQNLHSQQQRLVEELMEKKKKKKKKKKKPKEETTPEAKIRGNFNLSTLLCTPSSPTRRLLSPPSTATLATEQETSANVSTAISTTNLYVSPSSSPTSPALTSMEEPRRRAPRALTGRHVRSGTGASPKTLELLRNKIQERLKLKELLKTAGGEGFFSKKKQRN